MLSIICPRYIDCYSFKYLFVITKVKEKSLQVLEKELDRVFSEFIRLRDSVNGYVICFVCGGKVPWRQAQNGHFVKRANMVTRFSEINCNGVCEPCNVYDPEHDKQYRYAMIQKHGLKEVERLEATKADLQKYMRFEIQELIDHYKKQVKRLKQ